MRDFELYQAVLGLQSPWSVVTVDLDVLEPAGGRHRGCGAGALSRPRVSGARPWLRSQAPTVAGAQFVGTTPALAPILWTHQKSAMMREEVCHAETTTHTT